MTNDRTNLLDWSALIPEMPKEGPRRRALYTALRRLIESGSLAPGAKLPTTRELSARAGLSRGAAVAAFEMLIADGFAEARVGAGTFVAGAVPRLAEAPPPRRIPRREPAPILPGALGVAGPDERTARIFRTLMTRRLARPGPRNFHYGDPRGGRALREEIAVYLRTSRGVRCDAEAIVVTTGIQQGLDLVIRSALVPGDRVWIEDPCYPMALAALRGAGLAVTGIPVDGEGLDPALGEQLAPGARAVYVTPSHQFPMGVAMTMHRRLALIDWARANDAWIVEDDYDSEFRYAGAPLTALQGIDGADRVVYLGTFSKALFPGLRIGYAVLPEALIDPVLTLRERTDRFPSTLADEALADLLREGHFAAHVRRARRRAVTARDALVEGLGMSGFAVAPPEQGLHLIARPPEGVVDVALLPRVHAAGLGARALSAMAVTAEPRNGLVVGFSGFTPEVLKAAASGLRGLLDEHRAAASPDRS